MRYPHVCYTRIRDNDITALVGLTAWSVKQANISTRCRMGKWDMRLDCCHLQVRFTRKSDRDDFEQAKIEAFGVADEASLQQDSVPPQDSMRPQSDPTFDWNGYVDRLMKLPRR
ncbi:hypothetical protein [Methylobacterium sp. J-077]|uniref:hypothetical protein n=1 Tax=Methylobacterium sp. J-077 TaxID=2836656 RepID=UPI001FBA5F8F|nr:hypothetical protein [Methylobacterium sp. J-077]MCJ2125697.1 hypothetical protein [Methylobacterium sp. J-077]